jgi:folate-dependent phosphoribosylglycinamide formyltransferase PurN
MRLILCVKRDLHGCIFLNRLLPRLAGHRLRVLLSDKTRPAERAIPALAELAYLERGLPVERLFPLLDRQPETGAEWATFAGLAHRHGCRCEIVDDINAIDVVSDLRTFAPDLIVSARFSHIFKPPAIAASRYGVINIHPGELPAYAGLFAPMRTVAEGGRQLVCCMHFMDDGIDSGPLVAVERLPYRPSAGLLDQIAELYPLAIEPLLELLVRLAAGRAPGGQAQDIGRRRYRSMPTAAEVAAFLAAGHRFWQPEGYDALLARFMPDGRNCPPVIAAGG